MPCDPSVGLPRPSAACPDAEPETGWLTVDDDRPVLAPFAMLGNDADGEAYARAHDVEYPFPNDYLDAPTGPGHLLALSPSTVCTGIILVGYRSPLRDHVVGCDQLADVAERRRVPVAVWSSGGELVQVSELYRP